LIFLMERVLQKEGVAPIEVTMFLLYPVMLIVSILVPPQPPSGLVAAIMGPAPVVSMPPPETEQEEAENTAVAAAKRSRERALRYQPKPGP
jgi:hypothetical protein